MKQLAFKTIDTKNTEEVKFFNMLMKKYIKELDENKNNITPQEFLTKRINSIIAIQGDSDRHLEYCYDGDRLIGFLYGKIDRSEHNGFKKVGYGCIMDFYVLPEYRRKSYGTEMFLHLQSMFRKDGVKMMYLPAESVTSNPFWEALGFVPTGEIYPENKEAVYEKTLGKEVISFSVSEFLTSALAEKIAQAQWGKAEWFDRIISLVYEGKTKTDCFNVIAQNECGKIVGRLCCLQNEVRSNLWYYGDLFVIPEYRRRHIAEKMLKLAEQTLTDKWCDTLRCYVEPDNTISQSLQMKAGFIERPYKSFNNLINDGEIMFEKRLTDFHVNIVAGGDIRYVTMLYGKNVEALHGREFSYSQWCSMISAKDTDERHFLIRKGAVPCAYLKVNGLQSGNETGWISILAVEPVFHRRGVGSYAVSYAEEFLHNMGKSIIKIHTTSDNIPAQKLYEKCGYNLSDNDKHVANDGVAGKQCTFSKFI